eukprot:CAMPEP_0171639018 /NCGR_PEP_ID=MMETSP0990-20121206/29402_1 /TAXON_ID=483369 /ORGANISM="non described non described, Strain CCMP2098" /LENGTH=92 /DNA_ID=CAMNT_0012212553 /DNA_START=46 /DNA_END=324 /DNA_ORIENTATION=+
MASKTPMEASKAQDGTSGRLSMEAKYHLRQELNLIARNKCDETIKTFAECAQANGLGVVFFCRQKNNAMNECLHQFTNEDAFEEFKRSKLSL